ncbi:MAG TPA: FecR family protein [Puia sp.]|nr:FecR family protein [Puia sp.]
MQEDQFWLLVSLKLSGEASEEELAALEAHLQEHPEMGLRLETLYHLWKRPAAAPFSRRRDGLERHLQRLSNHLSEPALQYETAGASDPMSDAEETGKAGTVPLYHWLWPASGLARKAWTTVGVAASLLAFVLFYYPVFPKKKAEAIAQNTVSTKPGSKSKVQLPDGTQVWLNGDSRITYDESFRGPYREVHLCGEAYFDVAKDKNYPFIIHTSSIDVKVLGTSLNVRSYRNEKNTEALLIRGSIEVMLHNNPDKKIILQPNEKLMVQNDKDFVVTGATRAEPKEKTEPVMVLGKAHFQQKDSIATEVLWVKNKLAFDQETLEDVALKIERWYDVKIIIREASLRHTEYSGVFEDESLRQVMEALRMTGNFRYTINKKEVTITL